MTERWDVVVVGAGPAGAATATLLARRGYAVLLLDRARFPRPKACAEYLSPGVHATLARLELSAPLHLQEIEPCAGMDIVSSRGTRLRIHYGAAGADVQAGNMPRRQLDAALVAGARTAGVEVREGLTARCPVVDNGVVRGVSVTAGGRAEVVRGRMLIVADGARSTLAGELRLVRLPRWPLRLGLVAHFHLPGGLPHRFGTMAVGKDGYCGVAPLPGGVLNVSCVVPLHAVKQSGLSAAAFLARWIAEHEALDRILQHAELIDNVRGVSPIGSRSRRAWAPGALLVGDAASFFDPFTGEGIYRALRGAELAANRCDLALRAGDTGERMLRPYDGERRQAFRQKEAVTALVQLFVQFPWLMEYALPRLARRELPADTLSLVLGDIREAGQFLHPRMLWSALRP